MDIDRAKQSIRLLEMVLEGKVDPVTALDQWPDIDTEQDDLIEASWHDLSHYANDDDIRSKDVEYDKQQKKVLADKAEKIRKKYSL